jgi:N utilization substance protein B
MSHSRHHAREVALQILYRYDVAALEKGAEKSNHGLTPTELAQDISKHFEHFDVTPGIREFAANLVAGTLAETHLIDLEIEKFTNNWKIGRMALIDRNLIRMAYYEMTHFKEIPHSVTIDEAIELAKQFGSAEAPSFVNAILDNIRKSHLEAKPA